MVTVVDIGGTKTLVAQIGPDLRVANEARFETPHDHHRFLQLLQDHLASLQHDMLVIGAPGIVDPQGTIVRCGNLPWTDFPLGRLLQTNYPHRVHVVNDAKLAALAEINSLSPVPALGMYITVSTGIGVGVVANGKLVPALIGSEPGFMTIWNGQNWQKWEQFASGHAISEHFGALARDLTTAEQWDWVAEHLASGLYSLIPAFQPQVLVFGGSVGGYLEHFVAPLSDRLKQHIDSYITLPKLITAQHPNEAVLYGGYHYAQHQAIGQ